MVAQLNYWFPQPYNLLKADPEFVKTILRPLGMVNVRYTRLIGMTTDYLDWDGHDARELYGIGKYGSDSYEIFFRDNHNCNPTDKELKRYINENNPIDILVKGVYNTDYEYN